MIRHCNNTACRGDALWRPCESGDPYLPAEKEGQEADATEVGDESGVDKKKKDDHAKKKNLNNGTNSVNTRKKGEARNERAVEFYVGRCKKTIARCYREENGTTDDVWVWGRDAGIGQKVRATQSEPGRRGWDGFVRGVVRGRGTESNSRALFKCRSLHRSREG